VLPTPIPPTPSPPSAPVVCAAANDLNQTAFVGGKVVDFKMNATNAGQCCAACSNSTLQGLGCQYWQFYEGRWVLLPTAVTSTTRTGVGVVQR
jgi:hypothetical protein